VRLGICPVGGKVGGHGVYLLIKSPDEERVMLDISVQFIEPVVDLPVQGIWGDILVYLSIEKQ